MELEIKVNRVCYPPATTQDAKWFILATDRGTCKGAMNWRPEEGEGLTLTGQYVTYKGERQFDFKAARPNVPVHPYDLLAYVCHRAKGIGPAMCETIYQMYGDDWETALKPAQVRGLTPAKLKAFTEAREAVANEEEASKAIAFLMGKGATVNMANVAFEKWKHETIGVVKGNCYRLSDLPNYGFSHIDTAIRHNFDIADDDPRRVKSAIIYSLLRLTSLGSTVVDWPMLRDDTCKLVGHGNDALVCAQVKDMFADGTLKGFPGSQKIALGADYRAEKAIYEFCSMGEK